MNARRSEREPSELTIAITGMNARPDNPGPGLAVARCLKESSLSNSKIIGLSYDALDPGFYLTKYCDAGYLLPYPSAGENALIDRIAEIHSQENIDIIIPCLDAELPSFIRLNYLFKEMGILTFLPSAEQLRFRNKDRLVEVAKHSGINTPRITNITSTSFFKDCEENDWHFPLVVKGIFYGARIVHNIDQATTAFHAIAKEWGLPILVQAFTKGEEYNLTAVGDGQGNLINPVMMKKLAVTDKGKAWAGVCIFDEQLQNAASSLCEKIKWRGPLEFEAMKNENGEYQLIEINPRFPAWIYLSKGVGRNLPETLIKLMTSAPVFDGKDAAVGKIFIRYAEETIISMSDFENIVMQGNMINS